MSSYIFLSFSNRVEWNGVPVPAAFLSLCESMRVCVFVCIQWSRSWESITSCLIRRYILARLFSTFEPRPREWTHQLCEQSLGNVIINTVSWLSKQGTGPGWNCLHRCKRVRFLFCASCALPFFDFLTKDDSYSKKFPLLFYCPFPGEFDYNYLELRINKKNKILPFP